MKERKKERKRTKKILPSSLFLCLSLIFHFAHFLSHTIQAHDFFFTVFIYLYVYICLNVLLLLNLCGNFIFKKVGENKKKERKCFFCLMNIFGHMTSVGQLDHLTKTVKINTSTN